MSFLAKLSRNRFPVESKVYAATIGSGAGSIVGTFVLWLLGVSIFGGQATADQAAAAVAAVPAPVSGFVLLVLSAGGSFLAGYLARHTPRRAAEE